jgi:hypothetical protein
MFVVTVLAVIGIGVGVVAATTHQKVYGPSWGRFTAAFTGPVSRFQTPPTLNTHGGPLVLLFTHYLTSSRSVLGAQDSVGGADYPTNAEVSYAAQFRVRVVKSAFLAGVTESVQDANGISVTTIGPQCNNELCNEAVVVTEGRVVWGIDAFSQSMRALNSFVESFQPIA